jgi:nucleotide-binding universal stress UspA family protein
LISASYFYGEVSISSTGRDIPLLLGNITSISVGASLTLTISLLKPDSFNFEVMKQKILVVDDKIRRIIEQDSNEQFLKDSAKFSYRVAIGLTLILVIIWPLPLYFSGYQFSLAAFSVWVGIALLWAIGSAIAIVIKPLIEGRVGIVQVSRMIYLDLILQLKLRRDETRGKRSTQINSAYKSDQVPQYFEVSRKILVPIDGSIQSIKALNAATELFGKMLHTRIFALNVIEWTDEQDESWDSRMTSKIEEEGRRMLRSVVISSRECALERIVKVGDPPSKIAELAEKLDVDLIMMGRTGIGNSQVELGHVTTKVLRLTSKPVVMFK